MGRAKHTSNNERVLIFQMWKNGSTMNNIAKQLSVSRKCVQNAIKKAKQTKPTPENRGRPRKTSARLDREIVLKVKKEPFLSAPRLKEMVSTRKKKICWHSQFSAAIANIFRYYMASEKLCLKY